MKHFFTISLLLALPFVAFSQNCGIDTLNVPLGDTVVFSLDVFDVVNNDLSDPNQAVCDIEINFLNQEVSTLEMWLVSPIGDTVQLIGPKVDRGQGTLFFQWDIAFLNDSINPVALPDLPLDQFFNNLTNDFTTAANGGFFTGSYFPFQGSLRDFNRGPVNGTWQLVVHYEPQNFLVGGNQIFDLRINFCDSRGYNCCFAEAGSLEPEGPITACQGDTSLAFTPMPVFSGAPPDSSIYGYTYAIGQDGFLVNYDSMPDFSQLEPGNYQLCGLSYQRDQINALLPADTSISMDSLRNNLVGFFPSFCGELTDTCIDIIILEIPDTFDNGIRTICEGNFLMVGNTFIADEGPYTVSLSSTNGCDSVITGVLNIRRPIRDTIIEANCATNTHVSATGAVLDTTGFYTFNYTSSAGCDSIVVVDFTSLDLSPVIITSLDTLTCQDSVITLDGSSSGPQGAFNYRWEAPPFGRIISRDSVVDIREPGQYTLQLSWKEDTLGCPAEQTSVFIRSDFQAPVADAGLTDSLSCLLTSLNLDGSNSQMGATISYQWFSNDGNIINGDVSLAPSIDAAGTYFLEALDSDNGCRDTSSVTIVMDTLPPVLLNFRDTFLSCDPAEVRLNIGSLEPASFSWTAASGRPITDANTASPLIDFVDVFTLVATDDRNGCSDNFTLNIGVDTTAPAISIVPPALLDCDVREIVLDASSSDSGGPIQLEWQTAQGGRIIRDTNTLTPTVNSEGLYTLILRDTSNGCITTSSVFVNDTAYTPRAEIVQNLDLTCSRQSVVLGLGNSETGPNISYFWFDVDNGLFSNLEVDSVQIDRGGTYQMLVRDNFTKCAFPATLTVVPDTITPVVEAGPDQELSCSTNTVSLSGLGSDTGPNFTYEWTGPGVIADSLRDTQADEAGTYILNVTNENNGCSASDFVEVTRNPTEPIAVIEDTVSINCATGTVILDASASSGGDVEWFFGGFPLGGVSTDIEVNNLGTYTLRIVNSTLGCTDEANVEVVLDCVPEIVVADIDTLNCATPTVSIDASRSRGEGLSYSWTGPGQGCILDNPNSPTITARCNGFYQLILTNTIVGQSDTAMFEVVQDVSIPNAFAGVDDTLTCLEPTIQLDASIGNPANDRSYLWTTLGGVTVSSNPVLEVTTEATLVLSVLNTKNFCAALDTVQIDLAEIPNFEILAPATLTCVDTVIELNIQLNSNDINLEYRWLTPNGDMLTQVDSADLMLTEAGQYRLEVFDTTSSCFARDSVTVLRDVQLPTADAGMDVVLNCDVNTVTLNADNSSRGDTIEYLWIPPRAGLIASGGNTTQVSVRDTGEYQLLVLDTSNGCFSLDSALVILPPPLPDINQLQDQVLTCDQSSIDLEINVPQASDFSFNWIRTDEFGIESSISNDSQIVVEEGGTYTFIIRSNDSACEDTTSAIIQVDQTAPSFELNDPDLLTCVETTISLEADQSFDQNAFSYAWSLIGSDFNNDSTRINVVNPGDYFLAITNLSNGCIGRDTATVEQSVNIPDLSISGDTLITCNQDMLNLFAATDVSTTRFSWMGSNGGIVGPSRQSSILVNTPGIYQVLLTDTLNSCTNQGQISVSDGRIAPTLNIDTSDLVLDCGDTSVRLDASNVLTASGASPLYQWMGPRTNSSSFEVEVTQEENLQLQITDPGNGCSADFVFSVTQDIDLPVFNLAVGNTLGCGLDQVQIQANFSNYRPSFDLSWQDTDGNVLGMDSILSVGAVGQYTLVVNNRENACTSEQAIVVEADTNIPQLILMADAALDCDIDQVQIAANSSNYNRNELIWNWGTSSGQIAGANNLPDLQVTEAGAYLLTATHLPSNCVGEAMILVEREGRSIRSAEIDVMSESCDENGAATAFVLGVNGGTGPYQYSINGGAFSNQNTLSIPEAGTYQILIQDQDACSWDTIINLEQSLLPLVRFGEDLSIELGDSTMLTVDIENDNYVDLSWIESNQEIANGSLSITVKPNLTSTYTVRTRDANGCTFEDQITVFVEEVDAAYMPTAFSPNEDGINDLFLPGLSDKVGNIKLFQVFDRWGNVVFTAENRPPGDLSVGWNGEIQGEPANTGVYVYWLEVELTSGGSQMKRGEVLLVR